jgi:hypothetical protein
MPNATVRANAPASPKSAKPASNSEHLRALYRPGVLERGLKIIAKAQDEAAAKAEELQKRSRVAFAQAYHALLAANAGLGDPDITEEEQPERWSVQSEAERRLFTTPAVYPDQVWDKLTTFELIRGQELTIGLRTDSILLLALGSIKQDIINLDLLEGGR